MALFALTNILRNEHLQENFSAHFIPKEFYQYDFPVWELLRIQIDKMLFFLVFLFRTMFPNQYCYKSNKQSLRNFYPMWFSKKIVKCWRSKVVHFIPGQSRPAVTQVEIYGTSAVVFRCNPGRWVTAVFLIEIWSVDDRYTMWIRRKIRWEYDRKLSFPTVHGTVFNDYGGRDHCPGMDYTTVDHLKKMKIKSMWTKMYDRSSL